VGYALLVVMERLSPEQRVAFVLHDVFAVPFGEIAPVLSTTPAAARQLASRGRRLVRGPSAEDATAGDATGGDATGGGGGGGEDGGGEDGDGGYATAGGGLSDWVVTADGGPRHTADLAEQRRVVAAFLEAAQHGDLEGLLRVLAPDVITVGDGGGVAPAGLHPVVGPVPVARFIIGLFRRYARDPARMRIELVRLNGGLGLLGEFELPDGGRLQGVTAFAIADGQVTGIFNQVNPAKLARITLLRS
jgi:RNA polymerase sigma-70 factor, ECF subfamily